MLAFGQVVAEFDRRNAQVLGISVDSVPCNTAWQQSLGTLPYPLLSDFWPHGEVIQRYGLLRAEGYSERAVLLVDKTGRIRYIDVHDIREVPDPQVVLKILSQID